MKKKPEALAEALEAVHAPPAKRPARVDPNPKKRGGPPYIAVWLKGGCMVCGKRGRDGFEYAHDECVEECGNQFCGWASDCDSAKLLMRRAKLRAARKAKP